MLIVHTSIDGIAIVVLIREALVAEAPPIETTLHRVGGVHLALVVEAHQAERGGQHIQAVDFVAQVQVAHLDEEIGISIALVLQDTGTCRTILLTHHLHRGIHRRTLHHIGIQRHRKLTLLQAKVGTATKTTRGSHPSDRSVVATDVRRSLSSHLVHHQVQHTTHALSVIFHTRIGNHLDVLHRTGRHILEDRRRVAAHHHVRLAIDIDFEAAATVHRDIVIAIHRHHRHLTEHLQHRARLGIHILGGVIGHLIYLHLYQRTLSDHLNPLQLLHILSDVDRVEAQLRLPVQREGDIFVGLAH